MTRCQCLQSSKTLFAFCALLLILPAASAVRGEEPADPRKLLEALRADDFDAREAAKKKLINSGETVRALITEELAKKDIDPDYKEHLKSILGKLKDTDVMKAFDAPKHIDIDAKDETVNDVLAKIKTTFGFSALAKGDPGAKKITLAIKGATYLEAVDAVRKAANLAYDRNEIMQMMFRQRGRNGVIVAEESGPTLALRENTDEGLIPGAAKGPVLVFFESINYHLSRNIIFGGGAGGGGKKNAVNQKNFSMQGFLIVEPELRCSGISIGKMSAPSANNEVINSENVSLNNYWGGADTKGGFRIYNFHSSFTPQADPPASLNWKMTAKLQVPVKVTEKRLEKLSELTGKSQDFMGGTFTINKLERGGNGNWKMSYTSTGALMEMSTGGRTARFNGGENIVPGNPDFAAGMFIVDAQGKPLDSNSYSASGGNNSYKVDLELNAEPSAIVFRKPGETQAREFELEIPNVPIP